MLRHPDYTRARIRQLAGRMRDKIYSETRPADQILVSPKVDRIPFAEAQKLKYRPAKIGEQFGPLWATYWFKVRAAVPAEWKGGRIDLLWNSHSEATLWVNGRSMQGLNHEPMSYDKSIRPDATLIKKARGGEQMSFQVEMAANHCFGEPAHRYHQTISPYIFEQCDIALFDPLGSALYYDYWVLAELEAELSKENGGSDRAWAGELLAGLNAVANVYDPADRNTWQAARRMLKPLYARRNASATHELSAIGHAHIDSAWLWPLAETTRKCTRTFSSQVTFMEDYPEFKFGCSQAYQYAKMKETNPDLYQRMKARVKTGQFVPVGGSWVEPDTNIPSGEALIRQFLVGQRFFEAEFGMRCREFWEPDVFGYNGQLPQIMRLAGIDRFLTQKLSWNRFNKPEHHTFTWQGIDGSEVLAHFPPADNYNCLVTMAELRKDAREYKDHDRSRQSLMLFGHGDGGGGPTRRMLEVLRRVTDLQGLPRTHIRSSAEFFDLLEKDCTDRAVMVGELYFEYHRGTYTTQAATKKGNRQGEILLHDAEFLSAVAAGVGPSRGKAKFAYPAGELDRLWKILLLNQFHDILPGSSITLVYEDAARDYQEIRESAELIRLAAIDAIARALSGGTDIPVCVEGPAANVAVINTSPFARAEVLRLPDESLAFVQSPSYGIGGPAECPDSVTLKETPTRITLENGHLRAVLATDGRLLSLIEKQTGRESLADSGNVLELYDDQPTAFDAWDVDPFHMETAKACPPAELASARLVSPLRADVRFTRKIGVKSEMTQTVRLDAASRRLEFHCTVDWREEKKMLKVAFPVNVRAMNATYEMQFGCVERPTHYNTSYDLARYEVPAHKWADLSEHGFGVALLSESKYGFSTYANTMRMSLLRAPKDPDPRADMGAHEFAYALMPHAGGWREAGVVAEGYRFNMPLLVAPAGTGPRSFASVDDANLVLDTIKKAEDSDDIILRLYEAHGARGTARVNMDLPFKTARYCNALEDEGQNAKARAGVIEVPYTPFQIITIRLK